MRDYFLRRFLLIPPTLIGVTIIVFAITRLVPGGPLERAIMESQMLDAASGVSTQSVGQGMALSESQLQQLKEYYGFDKPIFTSYLEWTGKVLRGDLGSFQRNSLESNLKNLRVAQENMVNAESVIRDTDMAAEMSDFTKNQILLASGTAMAAQANQIPKSVLQLLGGAQ